MRQPEILLAMDKLMDEFASKTVDYNTCLKRNDEPEVKKRILRQLKEIENQMDELKEQLILLTAITPTN